MDLCVFCTTDFQYLEFLLRKNVGAAPCGRPQDGQPQGVAPTIKELFLGIGAVVISIFSLVAAMPHGVLCTTYLQILEILASIL